MAWINIKPENQGGGRKSKEAAAKLYKSGQLVLNTAAAQLLGFPDRVTLAVEPDARLMRLKPTTPDDQGGFSLSGGGNTPHRLMCREQNTISTANAPTWPPGGNTPHRLMCRELVQRWPHLVGDYQVVRTAGGIELRQAVQTVPSSLGDDDDGELVI